jgi:hypothetical protein
MIVSIHQPNYIPWLGFFHKIVQSDVYVSLDIVQFTKNSFQNRNKIKTANGEMWLTVPVLTKNKFGQITNEAEINNSVSWGRGHCRSIRQNYGKAAYFKFFIEFFETVYMDENFTKLVDLNETILKFINKTLGIRSKFIKASSLGVQGQGTELLVEICKTIGADTYLSGSGGKKYLEEQRFKDEGIQLIYDNFQHPIYDQLFGPFLPNLSIIDLIFNHGSLSFDILLGGRR